MFFSTDLVRRGFLQFFLLSHGITATSRHVRGCGVEVLDQALAEGLNVAVFQVSPPAFDTAAESSFLRCRVSASRCHRHGMPASIPIRTLVGVQQASSFTNNVHLPQRNQSAMMKGIHPVEDGAAVVVEGGVEEVLIRPLSKE